MSRSIRLLKKRSLATSSAPVRAWARLTKAASISRSLRAFNIWTFSPTEGAAANKSLVVTAKAATTSIPIVFNVGVDPVQLGLVASLNQPGGNLVGLRHSQPTTERSARPWSRPGLDRPRWDPIILGVPQGGLCPQTCALELQPCLNLSGCTTIQHRAFAQSLQSPAEAAYAGANEE